MYSFVLATMLTTGGAAPATCYGCHGCYGGWGNAFSCYGCYGCGGCYGCYGCGGCYGCYGGCYGAYHGWYGGCYGCYGGYAGCYGCSGYGVVVAPVAVAPTYVVPAQPVVPYMKKATELRREEAPAPARVTIVIPDGARLFVNDVAFEVNPAVRTFETPQLEPGRPYHYVFRAELPGAGKMIRDVQRVEVAAGKQVTVEFPGLPTTAAARR